jgi:hypothetical protein
MNILENNDFIITNDNGEYKSMDFNLNNYFKHLNQPAIVGGGKSIFDKQTLGIPIGLAIINKHLTGGGKQINGIEDNEVKTVDPELFKNLLEIQNKAKSFMGGNKKRYTRHKKSKNKNRKTRKK